MLLILSFRSAVAEAALALVAGTAIGALAMRQQQQQRWRALSDKLQAAAAPMLPTLATTSPAGRLAGQIDALCTRLAALDHRAAHVHRVSGLPTREPLMRAMEGHAGTLGLIELCDFDRLSLFNAAAAEKALAEIARRMERMIGHDRFLAHVDRSRFAIWYPGTDPAEARPELDAICYALQDRITLPGMDMAPQIRSVLLGGEQEDGSAAELVARGIARLSSPEDGAPWACDRQDASARSQFLLEQDLREAVRKNEFALWFQPFVNAATGRICGAEGLLRWRHPVRGLVPPASFIPVMESAGLAEEIGLWTLNAGCREAGQWERSEGRGLRIAINLSAHQLERKDLDQLVERTLRRHDLAASLLELELTETVASVDSASARTLFDRLRAMGVAISIDDFGAGYSSLSYLKELRFDKIKIDREFVSHVDTQPDSQAICQSIIALGRGLGISVLAEGVERQEEYAWLRRHGCCLFQGYYFSRPLEAADFRALLRDEACIRALTDLSPPAQQARAMMKRR
ncbi:putative bifunctional diguanylate cyclase/phosphodiesterase [Sphingobium bisphenolivorans]|uniref:putative bifunctional diguanylate cyclase/phosphodiesterase n=1 Tax=Sphingobium bisphenolivorans TaxID=1335760 RepID=UPI0003A0D5D0|nr:EAL domain-containing protein [Sphingobium bisphenolivorans]